MSGDGKPALEDVTRWAGVDSSDAFGAENLDVVFRRQPRAVLARHRIAYRTGLLVLVLSRFNLGAAKFTNLHTLMWAMRTARTRQMLKAWWDGRRFYNTVTDRFDPDLHITLNLAVVDGLVEVIADRRRVRLTPAGAAFAELIAQESGLFVAETAFLEGLGRLSDSSMERALGEGPR